jgi:tRNA modification GTPase
MYDDTIAAVATPPGEGGIGVVRLSGPDSARIAGAMFHRGKSDRCVEVSRLESHRLYYGRIVDTDRHRTIDEVMLVRMAAPKTYTREDVVEIHCHGGTIPVKSILELAIAKGARLAEAGEFTLRAFLNGRVDLSQAEAVMAVVSSRTSESLELAVEELRGGLTNRLGPARSALIETLAFLDASADFPEDEVPPTDITGSLEMARRFLADILDASNLGILFHNGVQIAIVGRPNVGKSSLMNSLLRSDRAIVTSIAGTTRDVITESINLHGIPATLLDTAGIAETKDVIEQMGIDRSRKALESAALAVFVVDGSQAAQPEDLAVARTLAERLDRDGSDRVVVAVNKLDLPRMFDSDAISHSLPAVPMVEISTLSGDGIVELESLLYQCASALAGEARQPATVSLRQRDALRAALSSVRDAQAGLSSGTPLDLIAVDVRDALIQIGEITGENVSESVLNEIFSRFCIGK